MRNQRIPYESRLVAGLTGSRYAMNRAVAMLSVLRGRTSAADAARRLHLGPAAFRKLQRRALQAMIESFEPRMRGRPPRVVTHEGLRIRELEGEIQELRARLWIAKIREEVRDVHLGAYGIPRARKAGKP